MYRLNESTIFLAYRVNINIVHIDIFVCEFGSKCVKPPRPIFISTRGCWTRRRGISNGRGSCVFSIVFGFARARTCPRLIIHSTYKQMHIVSPSPSFAVGNSRDGRVLRTVRLSYRRYIAVSVASINNCRRVVVNVVVRGECLFRTEIKRFHNRTSRRLSSEPNVSHYGSRRYIYIYIFVYRINNR